MVNQGGSGIRERLRRGCLDSVAAHGFEAASVRDVITRAEVTREAFYRHYANKAECFADGCAAARAGLELEFVTATAGAGDRLTMVRDGVGAVLRFLARDVAVARCLLVEHDRVDLLQPEARGRRRAAFAARAADVLGTTDHGALRSAIAAIDGLARDAVLEGRADRLAELEDVSTDLAARLLEPPASP